MGEDHETVNSWFTLPYPTSTYSAKKLGRQPNTSNANINTGDKNTVSIPRSEAASKEVASIAANHFVADTQCNIARPLVSTFCINSKT
jgi:protein involved in polysaccharide export with SLBB domain